MKKNKREARAREITMLAASHGVVELRQLPRPSYMTRQEHRRLYREDVKRWLSELRSRAAARRTPGPNDTVVVDR